MSRENIALAHAAVDAMAQMDVARLLGLTDMRAFREPERALEAVGLRE